MSMKLCADIHGFQWMNPKDFQDLLTFPCSAGVSDLFSKRARFDNVKMPKCQLSLLTFF